MKAAASIGGAALAVVLTTFGTSPGVVRAAERPDDELGFVVGVGFPDKALVGSGQDDTPGPAVGVRYGHEFTDALGVSADLLYVPNYGGAPATGDWREMTLGGALDWFFVRTPRTNWFLSPGIGWGEFSPDRGDSASRGLVSLSIGQKFWPGDPEANLRWALRADRSVTSSGLAGADFTMFKLLLGASWGVGGPPPDDDGDGVPNRKDDCPGTPAGATVDARGCPTDSDGDGVYDGLDRCPDTPAGWPVDAQGCPTDADGDGVPDGKDKCPDTPKGATVNADGCPKDSDGDGVLDGLDRCPDTPAGAKVDDTGCPLDGDGDGVFDGLDRCPDTPKGTKVDATGCPIPVKAEPLFTPEKKTLVLEGVRFDYDRATLTPDSLAILDRVVASLADWPEVRVEVGGHTDSRGSDAYNQTLSAKRAAAVREYLLSKGIDGGRMTSQGYGEAKPIADNSTEEGRGRNRRVELTRLD